ncbi:MAG: helix-turn-helix transcriptional regulator [Leptolyngbyaceae cyanobacterium]
MTTRLQLKNWTDWLLPSDADYTRLLHADVSDHIQVCPPQLGHGYLQKITLRDDLTLVILDYTLHQNVVVDAAGEGESLELTFHLDSRTPGYSFFCPDFGLRDLAVMPTQQRFFKVELFFKRPTLAPYYQTFLERLPAQTYDTVEHIIQSLSRTPGRMARTHVAEKLDHLQQAATANTVCRWSQSLTDMIGREEITLNHAVRSPVTPAMKSVIGRILSCPYQGRTRRAYLERQALKLTALRFDAMIASRQLAADRDCIYQAAAILRQEFAQPPSIEKLARQVSTNRFKLNQGFHEVYGTTPFGYLRDCRLLHARRLLMTSGLSISQVATAVGYTCRSKFATAFRQQMGLNPKAFQMQAWRLVS